MRPLVAIKFTLFQALVLQFKNDVQNQNGGKLAFHSAAAAAAAATPSASAAFPIDLNESMDQATVFDVDEPAADESSGARAASRRRQTSEGAEGARPAASLAEYLANLPISSVGQKHTAAFECDTSSLANSTTTPNEFQLVWIKLVPRGLEGAGQENDITPLSLNKRIITPDKRFRVQQRAPHKWLLTIENVGALDDKAFYLCQSSGGGPASAAGGFMGGARLSVLVPPKLVEADTSPNLVSAPEFEPFKLACKVAGEPQAQIAWRREDGRPLDGLEQRFRHQLDRSRPQRLVSVDSSELLFGPMRREQAGAYLCIASNGVQPGVSQRMSVVVVKCRESERADSRPVDCGQQSAATAGPSEAETAAQDVAQRAEAAATNTTSGGGGGVATATTAPSATDKPRAKWKLSASGAALGRPPGAGANHSSSAAAAAPTASKRPGQQQQQQQRFQTGSDKTRTARPAPGNLTETPTTTVETEFKKEPTHIQSYQRRHYPSSETQALFRPLQCAIQPDQLEMEPFYLSHEEFWAWFNRDPSQDTQISSVTKQMHGLARARPTANTVASNTSNSYSVSAADDQLDSCEAPSNSKRMKIKESKPVRHISETLASERADKRYIVMYGKHRPGKKTKVWEGDGYLTLLNGIAHLCDLKGRMVEEPTVLDDVDLQLIKDESDILIGNHEVQIVEVDRA